MGAVIIKSGTGHIPGMGRKYDLVIFDMDGTLTSVRSSWWYILNELGADNEEARTAFVNGEIDEQEFMRRDLAQWMAAKPDITMGDVIKMIRNLPLISGIQETVATLHYEDIKCAICSGGLSCAAKMIADEFGFDAYLADDLETDENGRLTGEGIANVDLRDKGASAKKLMERFGATKERTIAVGDSFGDISMFDVTGMSIAVNPKDMEITGARADHVVFTDNLSDILDIIFEIKDGV